MRSFARGWLVSGCVVSLLVSVFGVSAFSDGRDRRFMSDRAIKIVDYAIDAGADSLYQQSLGSARISPGYLERILTNNAFELTPREYAQAYKENEFGATNRLSGKVLFVRGQGRTEIYNVNFDGQLIDSEGHPAIFLSAGRGLPEVLAASRRDDLIFNRDEARGAEVIPVNLVCIGNGVKSGFPSLSPCRSLLSHLTKSVEQTKRESRDASLWLSSLFAYDEGLSFRQRETSLLRLKAEYLADRSGACDRDDMDACLDEIVSLGREDASFLAWLDLNLKKEGRSIVEARQGL